MANVTNKLNPQIYKKSVNEGDYSLTEWVIHNTNESIQAVESIPLIYRKVSGDNVVEMNQTEKNIVNENEFELYRQKKINTIDTKTSELVNKGYEYEDSDGVKHLMSTSLQAQCNWNSIMNKINAGKLITDPYPFSKINGRTVMIPANDVISVFESGMAQVEGYIHSGQDLRENVLDIVFDSNDIQGSYAAIDAIEDNRT